MTNKQEKLTKVKLKGNESFNIREGWLRKGIRCVQDCPTLFSRDDAMEILGVGSKMVKSIRYWLRATGLTEERAPVGRAREQILTERFGEVIDQYDRYFDDVFTLFLHCMDGYGQEVSIFKSVLSRTGLDQNPRTQDAGLNEVLELIHGFIADCEVAKNNFEQLYQTLCAAPYGLRKGIIPILIAYELRQYKEGVIFYFKDKEMELTPSIKNLLVEEGGVGTQRERDLTLFRDNLDFDDINIENAIIAYLNPDEEEYLSLE